MASRALVVSRRAAIVGLRGVRTSAPALAASYKDDNEPSLIDKAKKMFGISKEHAKAAAKNQAQAASDISSGRSTATDELKEHGKAAKEDMKQWGQELKETAKGDMPETAKVRDLPPRYEGESVKNEVSRKPVPQGSQTASSSSVDSSGFRKM